MAIKVSVSSLRAGRNHTRPGPLSFASAWRKSLISQDILIARPVTRPHIEGKRRPAAGQHVEKTTERGAGSGRRPNLVEEDEWHCR
jgi:hypothetical protein